MRNLRLRARAKESGVYLWQLAERWGVTDATFSRKLRKEFTPAELERAFTLIAEISEGSGADG